MAVILRRQTDKLRPVQLPVVRCCGIPWNVSIGETVTNVLMAAVWSRFFTPFSYLSDHSSASFPCMDPNSLCLYRSDGYLSCMQ